MKVVKQALALAGLAFDVAKILFDKPWREEEPGPRAETPDEPVVRITPAAASMVARPAPAPPPHIEDEPLEGSIAARRKHARLE
jgi:hypothetical protein